MKARMADGTVRDMAQAEIIARDADNQTVLAQAAEAQTLQELKELDLRSIRALREELAVTIPRLATLEVEVQETRARLPTRR